MTNPRRAHVSRSLAYAVVVACCGGGLAVPACAGSHAPPPDQGGPAPTAEPILASGVNATVIVGKCPDASRMKVRTAQEAIQRLVGPCATVPGGRAHFSATLQPGGKIELASPEGNPAEGVVPTCVLQNRLVHRVLLRQPCTLDVQLDERSVVVQPPEAGAPDAGEASPDGG